MVASAGSDGSVIQVTATRNYTKGNFWAKGSVAGVCLDTVSSGEILTVQLHGVFKNVGKTANNVNVSQGDKLYVSDGSSTVNKTSASRVAAGYALNSSGTGAGTVDVLLALGAG